MAIREQIIVDVATVDVTDEYRVELWQERKRVAYSATQARMLARELVDAADRADALADEDMAERGLRLELATILTPSGEVVL